MVRHSVQTNALAALGIAVLLAVLAVLLGRALSTDFHPDARALTLLRELSDFEMRRSSEAVRVAADMSAASTAAAGDRAATASLALRELDRASAATSVAPRMPALHKALDTQEAAYRAFRRAHADTVVALQAAQAPLAALEHGTVHARSPEAALALASLADAIQVDLRDGDIERAADTSGRLAGRSALLATTAAGVDPQLAEVARSARRAIDNFAAARAAEAEAWHIFARESAGEQLQLAARTLEQRVDAALDDRERWRIYLVAYACALGIGLSWLFIRQSALVASARGARESIITRLGEKDAELEAARSAELRAQSQLVAMGRYWSIGQLTAGISQEIARPLALARAHLSSIRSALPDLRGMQDETQRLVDLLRSSHSDPRQVDKSVSALANHLQHLQRGNAVDALDALAWGGLRDVEHIAELMAQLRTFFRADPEAPASFNLNDAVHAALLITQPLTRGLALEKSLGDVPAIDCRPGEVIQLVLSLVARAAQSVPRDCGRIRVATRGLADGVALDVWSQGAAQGDDDDLAIARQIVARHKGGIAVRPNGDGTLIAVELPLGAVRVAASA